MSRRPGSRPSPGNLSHIQFKFLMPVLSPIYHSIGKGFSSLRTRPQWHDFYDPESAPTPYEVASPEVLFSPASRTFRGRYSRSSACYCLSVESHLSEVARRVKSLESPLAFYLVTGWEAEIPPDHADRALVDGVIVKPANQRPWMTCWLSISPR
jgi:hypothetical protein